MGIISALVDTCYTIRQEPTGAKVYGKPQMQTVQGPLIRCRLEDTGSDEVSTDDQSRRRYAKRPTLMLWKVDKSGHATDVRPSDILWVDSKALGSGSWQVVGRPRIIRKRTAIHHYECSVVQIRDTTDEEAVA